MTRVGPEAMLPASVPIQTVREACKTARGAALGECFRGELGKAGAPPGAVAFARRLDQPGFARALRPLGAVDLADVEFPYRANENRAWILVNGDPPMIDVDDQALLARDALPRDAGYAAIARASAQVTLWPGDRGGAAAPDVEPRAGGGLRIVVAYRLRNQCHACAVVGTAWFAFAFDPGGRFQGTTLVGVTASPPATATPVPTDPTMPIAVPLGREFRIVIASNRTTGYSWSLRRALDTSKVRLVETRYHAPATRALGAPGQESWTFGAVGEGETEIPLGYRRPWEKDAPPARVETFRVVIRPR